MDDSTTIQTLREAVDGFLEERDWRQFHKPQNLAVSLSIEAAELLEIFQWDIQEDMKPEKLDKVKEELADVIIYSLSLANSVGVDVSTIVMDKLKINAKKYPVEKNRGKITKNT